MFEYGPMAVREIFNIGVIEYGTKFRIQRTLIEYGPETLLEYDTFAPIE